MIRALRLAPIFLVLAGLVLSVAPAAVPAQSSAAGPTAANADKDLVAVMDLETVGAEKAQAAALTEQLRKELLRSGRFVLVDRSQMDKLLEEQALQQSGCTTSDCAVRVGRILGVRKLVLGKLTRIEDTLWQVSVTLVDVETAQTLRAETLDHAGTYRDLLLSGLSPLAARLAGSVPVANAAAPSVPALKAALFPVRVSGAPPQAERAAAMGIASIVSAGKANLAVPYSAYPDLFSGGKGLREGMASGAWKVSSQKPDADYVAAKAKELGVDAVFMIHVMRPRNEHGGGTLTVYRIDTATHEVIEQSKEWKSGFVTLAVAEATREMLSRMHKGRPTG